MRIILIFFVLCSFSGISQDLRREFESMNEHISTLSNYRLSVKYLAKGASDIIDEGVVSVFVDSSGLFYNLGSSSIVINHEKMILLDDNDRTIIYSDNQKVKKRKSVALLDNMMVGIDTLISSSDSITFYNVGGVSTYNLRFTNSYFDLVQVSFENHVISKIEYYYNSDIIDEEGVKTTCEVLFEENVKFDHNYLNTAFYMTEKDGKLIPSQNFNNYLIIYNESLESYID